MKEEKFGQYYHVCYCWPASNFIEILKENGKDPEWLRMASMDESKRKEFLAFNFREGRVGNIEYLTYSSTCEVNGNEAVIDYCSQTPRIIDNKAYFLNKAKAQAALDDDLKNEIATFFLREYDKEFE